MHRHLLPLFTAALLSPTAAFSAEDPGAPSPPPHELGLYSEVVAPIFASKCVTCHGEEKSKGDLRMDSFAALMEGGSSGESVVPGDEDSELIYRIVTDDEDDHMPPEGKTQLSPDEIEVIKWWIASGADESKKVGEFSPDEKMVARLETVVAAAATAVAMETPAPTPEEKEAKAERAKAVAAKAEAVSQELGVPVLAIANGEDKVQFNAVNVTKTFGDPELDKLAVLSDALVDVNLARTQVTDAGLETLGKMGGIKRLRLENTKVGDGGVGYLANLGDLEYLNLYGTGVTDEGIAKLSGLKGLKKLFVWETGVTREGAEKLVEQVPGLRVNLGWDNEVPGPPPAPPASEEGVGDDNNETGEAANPEEKSAP